MDDSLKSNGSKWAESYAQIHDLSLRKFYLKWSHNNISFMYIEPIFTDINDDFNCNTRQAFWLKQADKQPFKSNSIRAKQELLLLGDKTAASVQQVSTRAVSVKTRPPLSRPQTWPSFKTNNVATQGKLV